MPNVGTGMLTEFGKALDQEWERIMGRLGGVNEMVGRGL